MNEPQSANSEAPVERRPRRRRRVVRRRYSRRRRWGTVVLLGLLLTVLVGYRVMTSRARLRRLTQAYLQQFFTTDVAVANASFSLLEGIQLTGVTVAEPVASANAAPLLSFDGMWLRHEPWALLWGRFRVDELVATRPMFRARFDATNARFNLQNILRLPTSAEASAAVPLPEVRIQDAQLYIFPDSAPDSAPVDDISLSLTGRFDSQNRRRYDVAWVTRTDRRSSGHFVIDFRRGVVEDREGGAPWLALEAVSLALEATEPRAKRWIDLLGVEGRFRIVDYAFRVRSGSDISNRLAIELDNASLSVPVDRSEEALAATERFLRLEEVSGRVTVDAEGATAELSGSLRGAPCRLSGRLRGDVSRETRFADVGFDVTAELTDFQLPRTGADAPPHEARAVDRWWRLRNFYRDFAPRGAVDITANLSKLPGADARVKLQRAVIQGRGAEVTMRHFPYRVTDVTGEVELTPDGAFINGLRGHHGDDETGYGEIIAYGWMSAVSRTSAVELFFAGKDISLDDDLCTAIKGRHRRTWERFSPTGYADVDVVMTRAASVDEPRPWTIDIDAQLGGVDAEFDGFPYPLRDLKGGVHISGDTFEVIDVTGRCGNGALHADGTVRSSTEGLTAMNLAVQAESVPLDAVLREALPESGRQQFAALNPAGDAAIDILLTDTATTAGIKEVAYDIMVDLAGATARPQAFPLSIEELTGRVLIRPERVELSDLRGVASGGAVQVRGQVPREPGGQRDVAIRGDGVQLTDALRDALPKNVRAQLADWQIDGSWDVVGRIGASGERRFSIVLNDVNVSHAALPLLWRVRSGELIIEAQRMEIRDVRAASGNAELTLSGRIDGVSGELSGSLVNLALSDVLRDVLPWRWRRAWNDLEPAGAVDLRDARISWARDGESQPKWTLAGVASLHDLALTAGVRMGGINGRVSLSGEASGQLAAASLVGDVRLDRLQIGNHALEDVSARLLRDGIGDRLYFDDIRARLHDGTLTGEVAVDRQGRDSQYSVNATLRRGEVRALVNAGRKQDEKLPASEMSGRVDGRFYLSGSGGDRSTRRGGGRVRVREAQLYRVPLLLTVLNVVNLTIPEESAFQEAGAELTVVGDELRFDDIELIGGALSMIGEGTMKLSTGALDIRLITVSPHRWAEMPVVSEMLEGVSRELIEVRVTGTLSEPVATAHPLRNMEAALAALLTLQQLPPPPRNTPIAP